MEIKVSLPFARLTDKALFNALYSEKYEKNWAHLIVQAPKKWKGKEALMPWEERDILPEIVETQLQNRNLLTEFRGLMIEENLSKDVAHLIFGSEEGFRKFQHRKINLRQGLIELASLKLLLTPEAMLEIAQRLKFIPSFTDEIDKNVSYIGKLVNRLKNAIFFDEPATEKHNDSALWFKQGEENEDEK